MKSGKIDLITGITSRTSQNWTNYIAQDKGFFEQEGLNHSYAIMGDMREGMERLKKGEVPIVTAMADTPILEIEKGAEIKIVATIVRSGFGHVVSTSDIKRIADLRGKRIAVIDPLSGSTVILREILRRAGLKDSDYEVSHVGGTPRRYEALKKGDASAAFLSPPYDFQAEAEGFNLLADYAEHFPSYPLSVSVNMDFAKTNGETVVKYLKALIKASNWIYERKNRQEAIEILEKNTGGMNSFGEKTYDYVIEKTKGITPGCEISLEELDRLIELLVRAKLILKTPPPPASKFVDRTFLDKAKAGT